MTGSIARKTNMRVHEATETAMERDRCALVAFLNCVNAFQIRQASNTPCNVDGRTINHGDTFVLTLAGPCNKFLCDNGDVMPSEYGCERDGKCFPVGDLYSVGCIQRQCGPVGGNFAYSRVNEGCSVRDVCLGVNEVYTDGCYKYRCNKGGTAFSATYSLDLIEWGCSNGGKCYPENATLSVQCRTMTCQRVNGIVGFRNTQQGCSFGNRCLQIGETLVDACRTFKCSKTTLNGLPIYSVDPIDTKCQDSNLDCHPPGSYFSYYMQGAVRQNCTCHVEGFNVQYFC